MPTRSPLEARAAWTAALAAYARTPETKIRRVRTPEGARKYGVPIGTPITRDLIDQFRRDRTRAAQASPSGAAAHDREMARRRAQAQRAAGVEVELPPSGAASTRGLAPSTMSDGTPYAMPDVKPPEPHLEAARRWLDAASEADADAIADHFARREAAFRWRDAVAWVEAERGLRDDGPSAPFDPKAAYARLDKDTAYRIRKKKAAVKFYAKRRDGKTPDEAQADADAYERAALEEALAAQPQEVHDDDAGTLSGSGPGADPGVGADDGGGGAGRGRRYADPVDARRALEALYGEDLHIFDADDPRVQAELLELANLPEAHHRALSETGLRIWVNAGTLKDFPDEKFSPRRWTFQRGKRSNLRGAYEPGQHSLVLALGGKGSSANVVAHEFAHAVDSTLKTGSGNYRASEPAFVALHKRALADGRRRAREFAKDNPDAPEKPASLLDSYFRQKGRRGLEEFFAEAYAVWALPPARRDEAWRDLLHPWYPADQRHHSRNVELAPGLVADLEAYFDALATAKAGDALPEAASTPATPAPPKAKAKAAKPFAPLHPPSGRTPAHTDPLKRGGDGPIHGYRPGQLAWEWNHDDPPPTLVEILPQDPSEPTTSEMWTKGRDGQGAPLKGRYRTTHSVKARVVESKYSGYAGTERTYDVENLWPVEDVPEPLAPPRVVPPDLASVRAAPPELRELVHADELAHLQQMLTRRKAVALDSASDSYEGYLTPDALELRRAKETGLRTIGAYLGLEPDEIDEAVARLESMLESWRTVGGLFDDREAMHRAVQRLRAGEPADDADTRAMLMQKVWSDATWRAKYGDDPDVRVPISRFVTGDYASQFQAAWLLTQPRVNPDYEPGNGAAPLPPLLDPADAVVSQHPLTSWTVTPAGVKSGWIGKDRASVELKIDVGMDETWLNVWSEERFRTRGLKAPGEFIVDDSRPLTLANVELDIDEGGDDSWERNQRRLAVAQVRYAERNADVEPMVAARRAAAGFELGQWGEWFQKELAGLDDPVHTPYPPNEPRREYRVYRHRETGAFRSYLRSNEDEADYELLHNVEVHDVEAEARLDHLAAFAAEKGWTYETLRPIREHIQHWSNWAVDAAAARRGLTSSYMDFKSQEDADRHLATQIRFGEEKTRNLVDALERLGLDPEEVQAKLDAYAEQRVDENLAAAAASQYSFGAFKPPTIKQQEEAA